MYPNEDSEAFRPDEPYEPYEHYEPYDSYLLHRHDDSRTLDRLTHLVLVDGRLVDTWSEPVRGTVWQKHADRFDRERRPPEPPPEPPRPPYELALEWLDGVCGGRDAVTRLDTAPLTAEPGLPDVAHPVARGRLHDTAELLDTLGSQFFDAEVTVALRRALLRVWTDEPETTTRAKTARHLAGGLCWTVGKANGLFLPAGRIKMGEVQEVLALTSAISGCAPAVQRTLRGLRPYPTDRWGYASRRPEGMPDLLALGHPDLLVSATRERLVRLRDRAVATRESCTAA